MIPQGLYIVHDLMYNMEQQRILSNFQKPFDLSNESSINSSLVVPNINQEAEQILLGSLLGDGFLDRKNKNHNSSYIEHHCIAQKEYILWKNEILRKRKIRMEERNNKLNNIEREDIIMEVL